MTNNLSPQMRDTILEYIDAYIIMSDDEFTKLTDFINSLTIQDEEDK